MLTSPAAEWVLDDGQLEQLRALQSPRRPDFLADTIQLFLRQAPEWLERLDDAATRQDAAATRQAAHTLKSSAAMLGAGGLSTVFKELEVLSRAEALDNVAPLLSEAKAGYASVRAQLEAVLASERDTATALTA